MGIAIQEKKAVVFDRTFYKEQLRKKFIKAAEGCRVVFIEIICDEHVPRERVRRQT
jgi:predicted kinase